MMSSTPRDGDKVRITSGKYAGTIGTYDAHKGVYTEGAGWTGNVHPGRNIETVSASTPDCNVEHGRTIPARQKSPAYAEWERMYAQPGGPTDDQVDAYNKKWKSQGIHVSGVQNRGLGRLLFGRNDDRFLWFRNN